MNMKTTTELTWLTAIDRCDRCGAQAYVLAVMEGGSELLFCAHHAHEHLDKLREVAVTIHDETHRLVEKKAASSGDQVPVA